MADVHKGTKRLSPWQLFKEVFNWYPSEYPSAERKLLFKLDLSILVFACLCCEYPPRALHVLPSTILHIHSPTSANNLVFVKYLGMTVLATVFFSLRMAVPCLTATRARRRPNKH